MPPKGEAVTPKKRSAKRVDVVEEIAKYLRNVEGINPGAILARKGCAGLARRLKRLGLLKEKPEESEIQMLRALGLAWNLKAGRTRWWVYKGSKCFVGRTAKAVLRRALAVSGKASEFINDCPDCRKALKVRGKG